MLRRARGLIVGVVVGLMVGGGIAWAAIPDDASRAITACYPKSGAAKGALRVIDYQAGERCKAGEGTLTWQQQGMRWRGPWNTTTNYAQNDVVQYNGASYVAATNPAVGHPPGGFLVWALLASRGATGPQGPPGPAGPGLAEFDELEGQPCKR